MPRQSTNNHDPAVDWVFTLTVAAVALLPRLFVAIAWAREPVWDGHYYHFGAERIAEGLGYSEDVVIRGHAVWKPWTHYPVGYSALLALFYKLAGSGLVVAPLVNALIGTLTVVVVHRLALHFLGVDRARIAAGLAALHPGLIAYSAVVMTEGLAALLLIAAALAVAHWAERRRGIVASGALLGLATLVRPSSLLVAPLIALMNGRPSWRSLGKAGIALAVTLAVVVPWTIRNCVRMDGCALVSTNGGWNLAIGALTDTGRFRTLRAADGCPIVTGQVQQDRCWAKVGLDAIRSSPGHWLALAPKKLGQTFDHESFAVEYLHFADPDGWPEPRRVAARELLTAFHRLLLGVAALSVVTFLPLFSWQKLDTRALIAQLSAFSAIALFFIVGLASDQHPFFLLIIVMPVIALLHLPGRPEQGPIGRYLIALIFVTALTHILFFGDDRYHIVVTPALCVLAAAALRRTRTETAG